MCVVLKQSPLSLFGRGNLKAWNGVGLAKRVGKENLYIAYACCAGVLKRQCARILGQVFRQRIRRDVGVGADGRDGVDLRVFIIRRRNGVDPAYIESGIGCFILLTPPFGAAEPRAAGSNISSRAARTLIENFLMFNF